MMQPNGVFGRYTIMLIAGAGLMLGCSAFGQDVKLTADKDGRAAGLAAVKLDEPPKPGTYGLSGGIITAIQPAQVHDQGYVWWWQTALKPGETATYSLNQPIGVDDRVNVKRVADDRIDVTIGDDLFTSLNFKKDEYKVYLYPVIGPTGKPVTRHYPMKDVEGERKDHHHHRSIWSAHGDIRVRDHKGGGSNYWDEGKPEDTGNQQLREIKKIVSGPIFGEIVAVIDWLAPDGKRDFVETRTYRFYAGNAESRIIDQTNVFEFVEGDTLFANTKEGGICSLRIATSMDEKDPGNGQMRNSNGQVGHKECWGKAAKWCDYVGPVDGKTVGIAVMDAPSNLRHPVRWHIRDYGLYTANPFGAGNFTDGKEDGAHLFRKGETVRFDYRILIHQGKTEEANVAERYEQFAQLFPGLAGGKAEPKRQGS